MKCFQPEPEIVFNRFQKRPGSQILVLSLSRVLLGTTDTLPRAGGGGGIACGDSGPSATRGITQFNSF
jgi:hypothetical protein